MQVGLSWTASIGASSYNVKKVHEQWSDVYHHCHGRQPVQVYLDTSVINGTNYYFCCVCLKTSGAKARIHRRVSITPGNRFLGAQVEGDLIANLQSSDLVSGIAVWTNRTTSGNSVGNFTAVGGGNLNVASIAYGSGSIKNCFL